MIHHWVLCIVYSEAGKTAGIRLQQSPQGSHAFQSAEAREPGRKDGSHSVAPIGVTWMTQKKVNRYGPPHFSDKENRLSIWIGRCPLAEIPDDYFKENYADEDQPFTRFSEDFGFGFYDHDFVEMNSSATGPKPVRDLLAGHSCSTSFLEAAATAAEQNGMKATELIFLMYDFEYDPKVTGIQQSKWLWFLGCFDYDKSAPNASEPE
jgi:Immunity protein 22